MSKTKNKTYIVMKDGGSQRLKPEYFESKEFKDKIVRWKKILKGMDINSKT